MSAQITQAELRQIREQAAVAVRLASDHEHTAISLELLAERLNALADSLAEKLVDDTPEAGPWVGQVER